MHDDQIAAVASPFRARLDRAREAGVPVEITVIEGADESAWIVPVDDVTIDHGTLSFTVDGNRMEFAYGSAVALPILPEIMPVDRAYALRAQAFEARKSFSGTVLFSDARSETMAPVDRMHIASTGIYPPDVLGLDWSEIASIRSKRNEMQVLAARDGSIGFSMTSAG